MTKIISVCAELTLSEPSFLQQNIFGAIGQVRSNNKRTDLKCIHSYLVRIENLCTMFATTKFTVRRGR